MRTFLVLYLMSLMTFAQAYVTDTTSTDSMDNFQPPPMTSPISTPMEQPLPPDPSTTGYAPGVNPQTVPTPLQQTGTQTRYLAAPLTVDTNLNMNDLMNDEIVLQYEYYYQDAQIAPWLQDAGVLANHSNDQSLQIQRYSDVIYVALYLQPSGRGSVACLPSAVGQGPRIAPQSVRTEVLGKVLPQVNRVEIIGTSDADGNVHCQIVFEQ